MRIDVEIEVNSIKNAIFFYEEELQLFSLAHNFGNNNILLKFKKNDNFCLSTKLISDLSKISKTSFSIQVENAWAEYERLKKVNFLNGASIITLPGGTDYVKYPLGELFFLQDPFGNSITIFEDFYDFLGKDAKPGF